MAVAEVMRRTWAMTWKDVRVELRARERMNAMLFFAALILFIFNFALGPDLSKLREAAPGLLWLAFLFTGMLGLGRALGETMAVTFVIGNANRMPTSLFSPGTSIASVLANEFGEAADLHLTTLFALGFLLFVITFVVLALAKLMIIRAERAKGT